MENRVSSSLVFDASHRRFSILNIYNDDEDEEENEIFYYKVPIEALKKDIQQNKEEAFNPYQNKCCIIS